MRAETDLVTGRPAGTAALGSRSVAARPQGPKTNKNDRLQTRRWSPCRLGASSALSIDFESLRRRTDLRARKQRRDRFTSLLPFPSYANAHARPDHQQETARRHAPAP